MDNPVVFVEDDADLRTLMALLVKVHLGCECLCLAGFAEVEANAARIDRARVVFLDVNLGDGKPTGIDVYTWLRKRSFPGKIFFLTGHARQHPDVSRAVLTQEQILEKPLRTEVLTAIISEALGVQGKTS